MRTLGILLTASIIGLASAMAAADGPQSTQSYWGENEFKIFCASCHGVGAKGDGPIASSLKKHPPDLTQLAKRNDGTFPAERVFKTIDGRTPVNGHGRPDMPVWGDVFAQSRESPGPEGVKARIESLVKYLEAIQQKE